MNTYIQDGLSALGDPTRLAIFEMIGAHPKAVNELAAGLPVSRPAVSQHLRALRDAGLVLERREGRHVHYRIAPKGLVPLTDWLGHLKATAESTSPLQAGIVPGRAR